MFYREGQPSLFSGSNFFEERKKKSAKNDILQKTREVIQDFSENAPVPTLPLHRTNSDSIHIPTGCVSNRRGLSHGLKNMPPACFLPSLRSGRPFESHLSRKKGAPKGSFLVREMGLEPTRRSPHAPQTCLSTIPTLSQVLSYYNCCFFICQLLFHFLSRLKSIVPSLPGSTP